MFDIEFTAEADDDLAGLRAYDRAIVVEAIEEQLSHEPLRITRNRKPVVRPDDARAAAWELRVGKFRVFYDVDPPRKVVIVRVVFKGTKTTEDALK